MRDTFPSTLSQNDRGAALHMVIVDFLSTPSLLDHITCPVWCGITYFGETSEPCLALKKQTIKTEDEDDEVLRPS